ncbi:MAG: cupin domain-containing protein [Haloarculaceae archaeon]
MGYHLVDPADLDPLPDRPSETRSISDAAGLETLGLRVYHVDPGEDVPLTGYHYHDRQEEALYVLDGRLHVETADGEYVVAPGQCFAVEPGNPHRAHNPADADGAVDLLAVGAPSVSDGNPVDPPDP